MADAIGPAQGARLEAVVRRVFAAGQPESLEYVLDRGGERRVFSAHAVLVPGSDDESPRVAVMVRDLSERMRLQTQLLEAEWLVSVGLLAAGVAHEINNPLAYSLLNLERIQRGLRDLARSEDQPAIAELVDAVGVSLEGCRRVQTIVQDLRRFSASGRDDEVRGPIDVRRVLDFAIDMVAPQVRDRAQVVRAFGDVPLVIANEGPLSQVFLNLIVNAAQAIPEGEPERNEVRVVTYTDDDGRAIVEVHDTGQGISPSVLPHIFDPFYTTRAPGVGTGLGLAICQRIATSLGGSLGVQTDVGRGSVFRCVLPPAPDAATGH